MRNLKKILALVLSLMMVLSVMVTASATYSDADDIQYTEAVEVMSALGILSGADGKFAPQGTLTRGQAAKIIAYVKLGNDASTLLKGTGSDLFTDVKAGTWYYDFVSYCANEGIINGAGDGKFYPDAEVTGYQFGKMLLVAAGIEGKYTGSGWELNVAKALKSSGLKAGLEKLVLTANITREQACQMAFNAMNYNTEVTFGYAVKNGYDVIGYYDTMIEAATAAAVLGSGYTYDTTKTEVESNSLAVDNYALRKVNTVANSGLNGYYWYVDNNGNKAFDSTKDTLVSGFVVTDTIVGTYTVADSYATVSADLGKTVDYTVNNYINGAEDSTPTSTIDYDSTDKVSDDSSKELVVVVTEGNSINFLYVEEVLTNAVRGSKVTTKTDPNYGKYAWNFKKVSDSNTVVTVYGDATAYSTAKYLVVAKNTTTALSIDEAKTVNGAVTATADAYIRVDGNIYYKANSSVSATASATAPKTVYLNTAGDVIYIDTYSAAATTFDGYAYVTAMEYVATPYSSTGLFGGTDAEIEAKATLVTADGKALTVDVLTQIVADDLGGYKSQYYLDGVWTDATADGDVNVVTVGGWYGYSVVDGAYAFVELNNTGVTLSGADVKTAGINVDGTDCYMNASTVISFVDYNVDTKKIESASITGYANISAVVAGLLNSTSDNAIVVADNNHVVSSITVYGTTATIIGYNFAVYAGEGEYDAIAGQYYTFVVNGEAKSYLLEGNDDSIVSALNAGDVVSFNLNAQGAVTYAENVDSIGDLTVTSDVTVKAISADGTYFVDGSNTVVYLADGYVVYDVPTNGYAPTTLISSASQRVTTIVNDYTGEVLAIFITTADAD